MRGGESVEDFFGVDHVNVAGVVVDRSAPGRAAVVVVVVTRHEIESF